MPKIRWLLIWLCFLANAIGYIDRANLAIAAKGIQGELGIDPAEMGLILSAFFWTYAFMQMPAGWVVDRIGVRISLTVAVVWWSLFTMATGAARSVTHFLGARLMLGLGESATMPSFTKTAFNWFPRRERGLARLFHGFPCQLASPLDIRPRKLPRAVHNHQINDVNDRKFRLLINGKLNCLLQTTF